MEIRLDTRASQSLSLEGLRNEIKRFIQSARKQDSYQVSDKLEATISSDDAFVRAAAKIHIDDIMQECLLTRLVVKEGNNYLKLMDKRHDFNPDKWHSPVGWREGDIHYGLNEYRHYWEAAFKDTNGVNK